MSSCSSSSKKISQAQGVSLLSKQLSKVCFNSNGRGRIHIGGQKYLYSFDSQVNGPHGEWAMAARVPFGGEEVLNLNFNNVDEGKVTAYGDFLARIRHGAKEQKNSKELLSTLEKFLSKIGGTLYLQGIQRLSQFCKSTKSNGGVCDISPDFVYDWRATAQELVLASEMEDGKFYQMRAHVLGPWGFQKITFRVATNLSSKSSLMENHLFLSECL